MNLTQLFAERGHIINRMKAVIQTSINEGRTTSWSEQDEFVELDARLISLDAVIERARNAPPGRKSMNDYTISRSNPGEDQFQGQSYVRLLIARTLGSINQVSPMVVAQKRGWTKSDPMLVNVLKAAVAGGGSGAGEWGSELVDADTRYTGDFIEYLYSKTLFDQLPFREVPANVTIKGQDGQVTAYWVGQSKAIPATALDFNDVTLTPLKVAALAIISIELMEDSSPAAEMLVRDALVNASSQRIDATLFSTAAASAGVSPAGLLNGVSPIAATGLDGDSVRDAVRALYSPFITGKNASDLQFVANPGRAKAIGMIMNAFGQSEFPGLGSMGGTLLGDPVKTGDNINEAHLILLKPSDIYKIGDGGVATYMSRDATIEQDTAPTGATDTPAAASANMTNMFQEHSVAIKIVRRINFAKRRASAVQWISDASFGDAQS